MKRATLEEKKKMVEMYENGASQYEIANILGFNQSTCQRILQKFNVKIREKGVRLEVKKRMVEAYKNGMTQKEAAGLFGYTEATCGKALKEFGIPIKQPLATQEEKKVMVKAYREGATQREAAAEFGFSPIVCMGALKEFNVKKRTLSEAKRQYTLNENFFHKIDSEEKAYILGFVMADAGVYKNYLNIHLALKDKAHIQKILDAMGSNQPIRMWDHHSFGKIFKAAGVSIASAKIVKDLRQFGVVENKSLILNPILNFPGRFYKDVFRGMVDGDGSIYKFGKPRRDGTYRWVVNLVGSKQAVNKFRDFVRANIKTNANILPHVNIYSIKFSGLALPQKVARLLYKDAVIYLDRKMARVDELLTKTPKQIDRSDITKEQLEGLYHKLGNWHNVADYFGIGFAWLYDLRKRTGCTIMGT